MNRGRGRIAHTRGRSPPMRWSPRRYGQSNHPDSHGPDVGVGDGRSASTSWRVKDGRKSSQNTPGDGSSQNTGTQLGSSNNSRESYSYERGSGCSNMEKCHLKQNSPNALGSCFEQNHKVASVPCIEKDVHVDVSNKLNTDEQQSDTVLSLKPADVDALSASNNPKNTADPKMQNSYQPNRERRNESKRNMNPFNGIVYRPGMVLLKGYIPLNDQVKIVKKCRDLGVGSGGFYQPGYRDGAKLHLKMMCLGKNWDPQTREYGDSRPFDGVKPPNIPDEFLELVEKAIRDSHALIKQESKTENPEKILPGMSPNICLVNFYLQNGHLGLHQDRDESQESLRQGFPVVSFSIGDKADFLYGDERDLDKAQKVELESGDVLIFGGKSRHIFHGVTAIHTNTAPKLLLGETNLRHGRLNLTFRQY
ncbi:hypothetical protein L6164_021360 [Bauhinia variegata]|uniref:Uncharacterized protein n=1 Tax=Bauhinia variegata TaxID=167791 RepID=A0ACB9N1U8_BAUVA|nr:hypothetical protein L6164_021360 [Bauhinia variegata]